MPHNVTPDLIENHDEIATILARSIRIRRAETPDAVAACIEDLLGEVERNRDLAKHADFQRRQGDRSGATESLQGVRNYLNVLRNQAANVMSTVDRCIASLGNTTRTTGFDTRDGSRPGDLNLEQMKQGLIAIGNEFHSWRFERRTTGYHLVARTYDIQLALERGPSFNFGQFDIDLDITGLTRGVSRPYQTIAVTPRPSRVDSGVPHPHVQGSVMCEGNGAAGISRLLEHGDFYSFFVIVNQTLTNYNSRSPYVALDEWVRAQPRDRNSRTCSVCSDTLSGRTTLVCGNCRNRICVDCASTCEVNERIVCETCQGTLRTNRMACQDCAEGGAPDCPIWQNTACTDCSGTSDVHTCGSGGVVLCHDCIDERMQGNDRCCIVTRRDCVLVAHGMRAPAHR